MAKRPPTKPVPEGFTREQRVALTRWHREHWPHHVRDESYRLQYLREFAARFLDRCHAKDYRYVDYLAALRTWIRDDMEKKGYEPHRPPSSTPNPRGNRPFERRTSMEQLDFTSALKD